MSTLTRSGYIAASPHVGAHDVVIKIYDLASNLLADVSGIALEKTFNSRENETSMYVVTAPAGHHLLTDIIADDGYPNLRKGNRKLVVWEDGELLIHARIFTVERTGDGKENFVTFTAMDAFMELGYDADERAGRPVRDATGNFIEPTFAGTGSGGVDKVSGPDLIRQVLYNSQGTDVESGPNPGEGPLPIDINSGTFDVDIPDAVDLSVVEKMGWPILIGDFIANLVETNVVDVVMRPVEPGTGKNRDGDPDPYIMVELSAYSRPGGRGTDRSATVHFDYWTGSYNAQACRHVEDFGTINNKLYDYLGPPLPGGTRWTGNITPGSPGTTVDPTDSRALYGGEFMQIRIMDTVGGESASRPLYIALWNAEQGLRVEPRDMFYISPNPDAKALFEAPHDFDKGDLVAVNTGIEFGIELAEAQRVYGFDKTWDRQGVARISGIITTRNGS